MQVNSEKECYMLELKRKTEQKQLNKAMIIETQVKQQEEEIKRI